MEYAIGKVIYVNDNAQVQVLFYPKNGFWTNQGIGTQFPPVGRVFAPGFHFDYSTIKVNDVICFNYIENEMESVRDDHDNFIIPHKRDGGRVWKCPRIFNITQNDVFDRKSVSDIKEISFFFKKQGATSYICGPVWSSDLSPKMGKEVKAWKFRSDYDTIIDHESGSIYLAVDMDEFMKRDFSFEIDCMSSSQLKDWLKGKLADAISPDVLKQIKDKIKELTPKGENDSLTKERFARIRHSLDAMSFDWSEIQSIRTLPGFKDVIEKTIQTNTDSFLESEKEAIQIKRQEFDEERKRLDLELTNSRKHHDAEKKKQEAELKKLEEQIKIQEKTFKEKEDEYNKLSAKREDLIEFIRIQSGIVGNDISKRNETFPYPLESIMRKPSAEKVSPITKDAFCDRVNQSLEQQHGFMRTCLRTLPDKLIFKTDDIRTGIFLASVLGNSIYQLCQPSPKWISFKEFWEESLQNIWDSAHSHLDIWHFLLIENFNIALPECWGMPLWNVIMQKTRNIPYAAKTLYPPNLRIIVSLAETESDDDSHIGLPSHISDRWKSLNTSEPWDANDNWDKFLEDKGNGLAINEEYFCPVEL